MTKRKTTNSPTITINDIIFRMMSEKEGCVDPAELMKMEAFTAALIARLGETVHSGTSVRVPKFGKFTARPQRQFIYDVALGEMTANPKEGGFAISFSQARKQVRKPKKRGEDQ